MIEFNSENPYDIKEEVLPLNEQHYEDDWRIDAAGLSVDWDLYNNLFESGLLVCITARDDDKLVGYMTTTVQYHPHVKDYKFASMDTMFVAPEYRGMRVASDLFETTEDILIEQEVDWFAAGFRDETVASNMLSKYGYEKVECTFGKTLRKS